MKSKKIAKPLLLLIALIIILGMLRLGFWQLDRAEQKRAILKQTQSQSDIEIVAIDSLLKNFDSQLRFRKVSVQGDYLAKHTLFLDNQTHNSRVGYHTITPMKIRESDIVILVNRGWVGAGESRQQLPNIVTPHGSIEIAGRLNLPAAQPPLWNDDYPISSGQVWQYLPIADYAEQMQLNVLPLVLELAPDQHGSDELEQAWSSIDDQWVAKHQGYAFQWFAMASAFFIACLILLTRSIKRPH